FYPDLRRLGVDHAEVGTLQRAQARPQEVDSRDLEVISGLEGRQGCLHDVVQVTRVFRRVPWGSASARAQREVPVHRGGQDDDMEALLMEEPGEVGGEPEVGVGAGAGEDEEQGRPMVLTIEGEAQVAPSLESGQPISVGETWHVDRLPLEPG